MSGRPRLNWSLLEAFDPDRAGRVPTDLEREWQVAGQSLNLVALRHWAQAFAITGDRFYDHRAGRNPGLANNWMARRLLIRTVASTVAGDGAARAAMPGLLREFVARNYVAGPNGRNLRRPGRGSVISPARHGPRARNAGILNVRTPGRSPACTAKGPAEDEHRARDPLR